MSPWQSSSRRDAATKLADVLFKTLASAILPGPAATLVGEAVGKGLDALSDNLNGTEVRLARQIEGIAFSITSSAIDEREFHRIPPNDIEAAILAVSDTISSVPIDGRLLRESGYSALRLAEYYRNSAKELLERARLWESEYAYLRILESVSHQVAAVLRVSPEAHALALADLTHQLQSIQQILNRAGALYSHLQHAALDEYLLTYRLEAGKRLSRDRRSTSGGGTRWLHTTVAYVEQRVIGSNGDEALDELLMRQRRVLVEAAPGHGKTMLLRQTFLQSLALHGSSAQPGIPIYIDLRGFDEFLDLEASVYRTNKWLPKGPEGWVERLVRNGDAMILLDNVEDLLVDATSRVKNEMDLDALISDVVGQSAVIMAARQGTFSSDWKAQNDFATVNLRPEAADQVFEQIRRWHEAVASECNTVEERDQVSARGQELLEALCQVSDLKELGQNPLICALMCEAFLDSSLSLPRDWIALVDDVLQRLAVWDSRPNSPITQGVARAREIQHNLAGWAIHNDPPFNASHLADAVRQFVANWGMDLTPEVVVDRILSRTSLLRRESQGLAFISEEVRDHLAAGDLISAGNVNYLRHAARALTRPRLVVAAAGRARQERASELVTALLDDAIQNPEVSPALTVIASCCASASRSLEPEVRDRLTDAVAHLLLSGDAGRLADQRVAPLALDMLSRLAHDEGTTTIAVAMAVDIAACMGESGLPALQVMALNADRDSQEVLWQSWSRFNARSFAKMVLSACVSVPDVVVIDSPEKFAAIVDLPQLKVVEVVCHVDASNLGGRSGLTIRIPDSCMVASTDSLGPDSCILLMGEEATRGAGHGDHLP